MSRFCVGTFLTAIKKCVVKKGFVQKNVFGKMLANIDCNYVQDDSLIGHMVRGAKNPPETIIETIKELDPSEYHCIIPCMDDVASYLDPNRISLLEKIIIKIVNEDDSIEDETIVDLINQTKKKDLPGKYMNMSSFLAGLFIYVVKYTNNKGNEAFVKELDEQFIANLLISNIEEKTMSIPVSVVHKESLTEDDIIRAKAFLIDHESERELIPLCQIAVLHSPEHKHVRPMYNEYNLLPKKIQKYILKSCNAEHMIEIASLHTSEAMEFFCEDLEEYELSSRRYLYMFHQYFGRAFYSHPESDITHYNNYSFIRLNKTARLVFKAEMCSSIDTYIYEYLEMRDNKVASKVEKPMDYLWFEKKFAYCGEEDLTFWLCRFVIDACQNLFHRIKKCDFEYVDIDDQHAETQEDLYYCALNALYNYYLCHIKTAQE